MLPLRRAWLAVIGGGSALVLCAELVDPGGALSPTVVSARHAVSYETRRASQTHRMAIRRLAVSTAIPFFDQPMAPRHR